MSNENYIIPDSVIFESAAEMLSEGHSVVLRPKGNSMLPFIHGSLDNVKLERLGQVLAGDIVLARLNPDKYILHRVYYIDGEKLTLMGDGNNRGQEHCLTSDVIGTVTEIIRSSGRSVDARSRAELRRARLWRRLLPLRRYILGVYRRLPWHKKEIKLNSR